MISPPNDIREIDQKTDDPENGHHSRYCASVEDLGVYTAPTNLHISVDADGGDVQQRTDTTGDTHSTEELAENRVGCKDVAVRQQRSDTGRTDHSCDQHVRYCQVDDECVVQNAESLVYQDRPNDQGIANGASYHDEDSQVKDCIDHLFSRRIVAIRMVSRGTRIGRFIVGTHIV